MKKYFPILDWLPAYRAELFKGDLVAGITVGVMLIPQGMAYAMLAGLPPIYGLYASILPLIIYAILGTSRQLAVGPVAMVSLLVAAGVGAIAEIGSMAYIQLAIVLALMVGVIQLLMGVFRLGFLVNFLSHPVISGFTSAAALIIGFSQLKHLLGIDIPRSNHIHKIIGNALSNIEAVNLATLGIGLTAILIIVLIKRLKLPIPGPLLAVVFGVLAVWGLGLSDQGVKIVGEVPKGLPGLTIPTIDMGQLQTMFPIALTIAFIGFMESIAVAKAIQAKYKDYEVVPNQELIALGVANIGGSMLQAFPTTGGFSRTAVNDQAGARTGMASVISALLIVMTLLFLTPLFYFLPKAILASVIMIAVFGLIDYKEAIHLWKFHRTDFWMLAATFAGTLVLGIEEGIFIGVALSMGMMIKQTTLPHTATLGKIPGKKEYRNIERFEHLEQRADILIVRYDARIYFANASFFLDEMKSRIDSKGNALKLFILDANSINGVDSTGFHTLEEILTYCKDRGIEMNVVGVKGPIRDILQRAGFTRRLGEKNFFMRIQHAVDEFDKNTENHFESYTLQYDE